MNAFETAALALLVGFVPLGWVCLRERELDGVVALELDPQRPFIRHIVAKLGHLKRHEVQLFGALALGYAALEITEGVGLFYRKRWAEWLTVVATSLLVPLEAYELMRHPSALKAGGIAVNVLIVAYLVRVVRRKSGSRPAPP